MLQELAADITIRVFLLGSAALAVLVLISVLKKFKSARFRAFAFWSMAAVVSFVTIFVAAHTIYENVTSATGGPVHWHADFKIFNCGEEVGLKDPGGISNRIGTPVLHEHGDNRIHVEGVVKQFSDVSLAKFFEAIGGEITRNSLSVPTNDGLLTLEAGTLCGGQTAFLQLFKYHIDGEVIRQEKITNYDETIPAPHSQVPPGDCYIIEFDRFKSKTNNICDFYKIAIEKGDYKYIP